MNSFINCLGLEDCWRSVSTPREYARNLAHLNQCVLKLETLQDLNPPPRTQIQNLVETVAHITLHNQKWISQSISQGEL